MAFAEILKSKVRKRAHLACCLCKSIGVEIHHVVPQEEGGPDTEDNAAPLCPSCHEIYGANPLKRKFIREARDHWFEICERRYASDADKLDEIVNLLKKTVSTDDLASFKNDILSSKAKQDDAPLAQPKSDGQDSEELIPIKLPSKYWVIVLFAVNYFLETKHKPHLKKLSALGKKLEDFTPNEITANAGPIISQGMIVSQLTEAGVVSEETDNRIGIKAVEKTFITPGLAQMAKDAE